MKPTIYSLIFVLVLGIGADALGRHITKSTMAKAPEVCIEAHVITPN